MTDIPKQFVGFPTDRDMTEEEALAFGEMLFDAIQAERQNQESDGAQPPATE